MGTIRSEGAAYQELSAKARPVNPPQIGAHFHKPAPQRITYRKPSRLMRAVYSLLLGLTHL